MIICSAFSDLNIAKMIMIVVIHEPSLYYLFNVSVCRIILLLSHLEVYFFVWEDEVAGLSGVVVIVFIGVVVLVIPSTAAGNTVTGVTGVTGVTALGSGLETDDRSIGEVGRSGAHCWPQAGVADLRSRTILQDSASGRLDLPMSSWRWHLCHNWT